MNASAFFSVYLDKAIIQEMIKELKISITKERLDAIWPKATFSPALSFEKKRQQYLFSLIAKKEPWDSIAEKCQYFETAYDHLSTVAEIRKTLENEYGGLSAKDAASLINAENKKQSAARAKNEKWLTSLKNEERRIADFTQFLIEFRDTRKDILMKSVTGFYRISERITTDARIPREFISSVSIKELEKGTSYIREHRDEILNRHNGTTFLVQDNNDQEIMYGSFDSDKKTVNDSYLRQQGYSSSIKTKKLKGQTGSKGKVTGIARVINNFEQDKLKLKPGEILVTGMTRPEFVPLMKKSSGIITDEGGVTCHAAIVSRELGIPCIIGTKFATHLIKDRRYY